MCEDFSSALDTVVPAADAAAPAADAAAVGADTSVLGNAATDAAVPAADAAGTAAALGGQTLEASLGLGAPPSGLAGAITPVADAGGAATVGAAPSPLVSNIGVAPAGSGAIGGVTAPLSVGGPGADVSQVDPSGGFSAATAAPAASATAGPAPFGSDKVPEQSLLGKPDAPQSGFAKFLDDPLGKTADFAGDHFGTLAGAGILGVEALNQPTIPGANTAGGKINATADQLAAQGEQLQGFLSSGTLPPGVAQGIKTATESAKATIRSQYAARGMSGSSAEMQDLAAADNAAQTQGTNVAMNLLQTGINETGLATKLYETILQQSLTSDQGLSDAIAKFAGSLAGGGGQTIKVSAQ